ncbi:MAG: hypothetical protein U0931_03750 [Vulcanimicrobiota bacterium]
MGCAQTTSPTGLRLENPALAESVYQDTVQRVHSQAQLPASDNGFASISSLCDDRFWDSGSAELTAFTALEPRANLEPPQLVGDFRKHAGQAAQDVARFETLLPRLEEANSKARCSYGFDLNWNPLDGTLPQHTSRFLRVLVRGLRTAGRYHEWKGNPQIAADRYLLALELSNKWMKSGPFVNRVTAASCQDQAALSLLHLLSESRFPAAYYRRLGKRLETLPESLDDLNHGADESYVMGVNCLTRLQSGELTAEQLESYWSSLSLVLEPDQHSLLRNGAHLAEEKTLFQNIYLANRPFSLQLEAPPESLQSQHETQKARSQAFLLDIFPCAGYTASFRSCLTHLSALRLLVALQGYREERKEYPPRLQALLPEFLGQLPLNRMSPDGAFGYRLAGKSFILDSVSDRYTKVPGCQREMSYFPLSFKI